MPEMTDAEFSEECEKLVTQQAAFDAMRSQLDHTSYRVWKEMSRRDISKVMMAGRGVLIVRSPREYILEIFDQHIIVIQD